MRQLSITDTGIVVGEPISHTMATSGIPYDDSMMGESSLSEDEIPNVRGLSKDVSA
jgi:hypothetical protein